MKKPSTTPKPDRLMEILEDLKHVYDTNYPDEIVEFGRSAAEAHAVITALMSEVIGEDDAPMGDDIYKTDPKQAQIHNEFFAGLNNLRAEQRQRLTALTTPAKAEEVE